MNTAMTAARAHFGSSANMWSGLPLGNPGGLVQFPNKTRGGQITKMPGINHKTARPPGGSTCSNRRTWQAALSKNPTAQMPARQYMISRKSIGRNRAGRSLGSDGAVEILYADPR